MPTVSVQRAFEMALQDYRAGRVAEADGILQGVLAAWPQHAGALHLLGVIAHAQGRYEAAVDLIRRAIVLRPDLAEAHCNLGSALKEMGQLEEAIAAYRRAIALRAKYPIALSNLGVALKDAGRLDGAIAVYREAIALSPDDAAAHGNLGNALWENGQPDEAIEVLRRAIALDPGFAMAHNNLGNALKDRGDLDEAIAAYRGAVALRADYPDAHSNLLYTLYFHPGFDGRAIAEEHRTWNREHAEALGQCVAPHENDRTPDRRLRIGYVSADLREHPVGRFMLPLLAGHDRGSFEIFCYTQVRRPDALTERLRGYADHWHRIDGQSDQQVAGLIREHGIDILVDLSLHMARHRLLVFARKPAPIQVTYLAYAGTSGLRTMDYRLSDFFLDPPAMDESIYSERTVRLPQTYWCYEPMGAPAVGAVPALDAGGITFGCLNNFCKVTTPTLAAWARILQGVPGSRLLLHAAEGSHRQRTVERLQELGVDGRRVEFVAHVPMAEYLELYGRIDIALDSFPCGGGTTSCDAFWMGVPVISLRGETAVGRAGMSLAMNLGLPELVAQTVDEYVRMACDLAADLPQLGALRSSLRERMGASPLMDARGFARNVEGKYREMWCGWCGRERSDGGGDG